MNSSFKHKDKKIIIPEGVQVRQYNEKICILKGRYFYGGETANYIILQSEPFKLPSMRSTFLYILLGFVMGFLVHGAMR